ncbi:MAG: hypothetical protein HRT57_08820 [Crocinitomicaceae bacterium]|nr:hypothetical protein [Crocinitomicaceae bacterium]
MKSIHLKSRAFVLAGLIFGFIAGAILYLTESPEATNWLVYEYEMGTELPDHLSADTLIKKDGIFFRNAISSYADTLKESNIKRHDIKIYSDRCIPVPELKEQFNELSEGYDVSYVSSKCTSSKSLLTIFKYTLIGLFLGALIQFLLNLRRKEPKTD